MMRTTRTRRSRGRLVTALIAGLFLLSACGDGEGPAEPVVDIGEVTGTWTLSELAFDPQGLLEKADILTQLGTEPQLVVTPSRAAQLVYRDPASGLFRTIQAGVRTTPTGMELVFRNNSGYDGLLFAREMEFQLLLSISGDDSLLTFDGHVTGSVSRQRLRQLVPDWQAEQLLDPVPGRLRVVFRRG